MLTTEFSGATIDLVTVIDPRDAGVKSLLTKVAPGIKWSNRGQPLPTVPHCRIALDTNGETMDVPSDVTGTPNKEMDVPAAPKRKRTRKRAGVQSLKESLELS